MLHHVYLKYLSNARTTDVKKFILITKYISTHFFSHVLLC